MGSGRWAVVALGNGRETLLSHLSEKAMKINKLRSESTALKGDMSGMRKNRPVKWGIIVDRPNLDYWKNSLDIPLDKVGKWCSAYNGQQKSPAGHAVFNTRQEADKDATEWTSLAWTYSAKKYPLYRKL
jgi:hypothetical protein